MSDHYSKNCDIQAITTQDFSPVAIFIAKNTINHVSAMCVDYLTEQLARAYMDKFGVVMEGRDRTSLRILATRKCAEFLIEAAKNIAQDEKTEKSFNQN